MHTQQQTIHTVHTKTMNTNREIRIIQVVPQDGPLFKLSPSPSESIIIMLLLTSSLVMGLVLAVGGGVVGSVVDGGKVVVTLVDIVTVAEVEVCVLVFSSVGAPPDMVVFIIVP